jgi:hypothetical protein
MLGFIVVLIAIGLSLFFPPGGSDKIIYWTEVGGGSAVSILIGLFLYWRGARSKQIEA